MARSVKQSKVMREQCWRVRIAACTALGKSIVQWCREEGVAAARYHWWKGELKRRDRAGALGDNQAITAGSNNAANAFIEIHLVKK